MNKQELSSVIGGYRSEMYDIKKRLSLAYDLYNGKRTLGSGDMDYEVIALNFRKIAEILIFANMTGHHNVYSALHPNYEKDWNIGKIINKIKAINAMYYPNAVKQILGRDGKPTGMEDMPDGSWMTEEELCSMWGKCSDLVHARNPFALDFDHSDYRELFNEWGFKLNNLLSQHMVLLADKQHVVKCIMSPFGKDVPEVTIFKADAANSMLRRYLL